MSEGGRGQKRGASTAWRVWLPPRNDKQARRALRKVAPLKRGCAVEVHESGKNSVLLVFQKKRAYDSVHGWASRATGQQIGFRLTETVHGIAWNGKTKKTVIQKIRFPIVLILLWPLHMSMRHCQCGV